MLHALYYIIGALLPARVAGHKYIIQYKNCSLKFKHMAYVVTDLRIGHIDPSLARNVFIVWLIVFFFSKYFKRNS